jgi:hypothetical protein
VPDPPVTHGDRALTAQYEQLRGGVLAGQADGWRLGLGVLRGKGLAGWMRVASAAGPARARPGTATPPSTSRRPPAGALAGEVVAVLAQMALAHT